MDVFGKRILIKLSKNITWELIAKSPIPRSDIEMERNKKLVYVLLRIKHVKTKTTMLFKVTVRTIKKDLSMNTSKWFNHELPFATVVELIDNNGKEDSMVS